jgi:repressor LexA
VPRPDALQVTERQLQLLRTLHQWSEKRGRMPSVRELAAKLKRSASTVHQHLAALEKRGLIERSGGAHGLKLLVDPKLLLARDQAPEVVPVRGVLQPGRHLRHLGSPYPRVSACGNAKRGDYALRVEGDRLNAEGIFHGDLVMIRPGAVWNEPAVVQYMDGSLDIKRVATLRDGSLAVWSARPGLAQRRGTRRAPGVIAVGRVLRIVREFEAPESKT